MNETANPAYDLQAEEALIGAMLLSPDAIMTGTDRCSASDFYAPMNRSIFAAVAALFSRGDPAESQSVVHEVQRQDGGHGFAVEAIMVAVTSALANAPSHTSAARYASIVSDMALLRRLDGLGHEISDMARSWPNDVDTTLERAESMLLDLARTEETDLATAGAGLGSWWDEFDERQQLDGDPKCPTGWGNVDRMLHGLHGGRLYILAARPGMGKSSFVGDLALNMSQRELPVLFASIEMSREELLTRFIARLSQVSGDALLKGTVPPNDMPRLSKASDELYKLPLPIMDKTGPTLMSIRAAARQVKKTYGSLGAIVIDYLQLMTSTVKGPNRQEHVADLARGLKTMARDLDVPVVALSQLSRGVESRNDKRPSMADLRESGEIENAADVVMFLYREGYYHEDAISDPTTELIVAKNRHGVTGTLRMSADLRTGRWTELAPERKAS